MKILHINVTRKEFTLAYDIETALLFIISIFLTEVKKIERMERYYVIKETVYNVLLKDIEKVLKIKTLFTNVKIKS